MYKELLSALSHEANDYNDYWQIERMKKLTICAYVYHLISFEGTMRLRYGIAEVESGCDEEKELAQILLQELIHHLQQKNRDALLEFLKMKGYELPLWITAESEELFEALPSVCLMDHELFYITRTQSLKKIDTLCNWEDWDEEFIELPMRYKEILGVDHNKGILYLQPDGLHKCYVEFQIKGRQFVFHREEKWIGQSEDERTVLLIDKNNRLVSKNNKCRCIIKTASCFEKYSIENNKVKITPIRGMPNFFQPYYMDFGGKKIEFTEQETTAFLWERLQGVLRSIYGPYEEEEAFNLHGKITVEALYSYLENKPYEKRIERLIHVLHLLKPLLEKDLFYTMIVLCEANTRYEEFAGREIIVERLRQKIEELEEEGFLKKCTIISRLRIRLLEDVYWTDEKMNELELAYREELSFVGVFHVEHDWIAMKRIPRSEGMLVGNVLVMPTILTKKTGTVVYNIDTVRTEISFSQRLTEAQVKSLVQFFNLYINDVIININHMEGDKTNE